MAIHVALVLALLGAVLAGAGQFLLLRALLDRTGFRLNRAASQTATPCHPQP